VTAVLDGQQRLTALNIGLRGSMAVKQPNKWWTNPDAFPVRILRLDLLAPQEPDEAGVVYRFRFLDDAQAASDGSAYWFKVPDIFGMEDGPTMLSALMESGLQGDALKRSYATLDRLHRVVHTHNLINYYEEETQDLERWVGLVIERISLNQRTPKGVPVLNANDTRTRSRWWVGEGDVTRP
jgi:hypothetical protein